MCICVYVYVFVILDTLPLESRTRQTYISIYIDHYVPLVLSINSLNLPIHIREGETI